MCVWYKSWKKSKVISDGKTGPTLLLWSSDNATAVHIAAINLGLETLSATLNPSRNPSELQLLLWKMELEHLPNREVVRIKDNDTGVYPACPQYMAVGLIHGYWIRVPMYLEGSQWLLNVFNMVSFRMDHEPGLCCVVGENGGQDDHCSCCHGVSSLGRRSTD